MKLSKRLSFLASSAGKGTTSVWDIGCDHGLLGLSFLDRQEITAINLVDPSDLVIKTLQRSLIDSYITIPDKIKIHHKPGQEIQLDHGTKTIFVAGMGGKEIMGINANVAPQMGHEDLLIISPHRNLLMVREQLNNSDLRLWDEQVVWDMGRFYPVICLKKDHSLPKVSPYGERIWRGEWGEAYLKHELKAYGSHQDKAALDYLTFLKSLSP